MTSDLTKNSVWITCVNTYSLKCTRIHFIINFQIIFLSTNKWKLLDEHGEPLEIRIYEDISHIIAVNWIKILLNIKNNI
jgi:hypothetical protein